ncbi:hypothetical protein RRG08_026549 [Elysia crispata]|uniref:Uncharacterized protein n=1 Tax=Elysia crispata TaxID=231223 RepID=A0AAE0Y3Y1_9GAST|nr:hypothetical protein RRG08_026549 [Elysia crispata]
MLDACRRFPNFAIQRWTLSHLDTLELGWQKLCWETAMPPKRELSQEQLPAAEAKKRFGIGTTRLYKIWRSCPPRHEVASPLPVVLRAPSPLAKAPASPLAKALAGAPDAGGSRVEPTVVDFYNRLDRLEARVEQATNLLVQALAQLPKDDDSDLLEELLADEQQEIAEQLRETRHEQAETRMDLQKVGKVQNWAYISIAAVLVWKVVAATWNRCTPPTPQQKPQPQKPPLALLQEAESAGPGDPFYMA